MRIGFSLVDLAMGGAQVFFVQLAQGLAARGHAVSYWLAAAPNDPSHINPTLKADLDKAAQSVRHPWSLWRTDIVHLDGYHSLRRKLFYLPRWGRCVETYHSAYSVRRAGPIYPRYRVAVSRAVQELIPASASIIYQGTPLPSAPFAIEKSFDVAILGRIHPVKNHRLFLAVCEELFRRRGGCSALIIGGHSHSSLYQQEIETEIERLRGMGMDLRVVGDVSPRDLWRRLSQARVLLVTSRSEGFGRMAVEAMACGVPVVANPVGGLQEIVQPSRAGFLVEKDSINSFVEKTMSLLEDKSLCKKMGRQGRDFAENQFSLERMVTDYEALYQRVTALA